MAEEGPGEEGWVPFGPSVSRYAETLVQLPYDGEAVLESGPWRCQFDGCEFAAEKGDLARDGADGEHKSCEPASMWLNLTDGFIGCGRMRWDGTGGRGHALQHYEMETSAGPLVVRLGTITPTSAEVFSYAADEDDSVQDPMLTEHLAHFGIDREGLQEVRKTLHAQALEMNTSLPASLFDPTTMEAAAAAPEDAEDATH